MGWHFLGRCVEGAPFTIDGVNFWEADWHSLPEEVTVTDPVYGESIALSVGWLSSGRNLFRVAAAESSPGVYAFAEFRGDPPACGRCSDLRGEFKLRAPTELAKALRIAKANVADGTLVGGVGTGMRLSEISPEGPWPDVLDLRFMCASCGRLYGLEAETYHGHGGRWYIFDTQRTA